jgi:hypothetical protein
MMLYELKRDYADHKQKALMMYRKLYKKTPDIEFKNRIEELERLR